MRKVMSDDEDTIFTVKLEQRLKNCADSRRNRISHFDAKPAKGDIEEKEICHDILDMSARKRKCSNLNHTDARSAEKGRMKQRVH
ncbi:unnamed protein product [Acanthoscelides obtectus]|uniref:Uncharacterized protein n=1 Tax=Acanthoscelides obtectus TaxID=200917 RepID=A0A9P0K2K1_ACAOB|nr:unnamed protein product [Acanthoscelides obtectus]CAK1669678.1 hypothetical protein AOBTE_LOCUS27163 [Acanthoscelides obtectus]